VPLPRSPPKRVLPPARPNVPQRQRGRSASRAGERNERASAPNVAMVVEFDNDVLHVDELSALASVEFRRSEHRFCRYGREVGGASVGGELRFWRD